MSVRFDFGLRVTFDGNNAAEIYAPEEYAGK